MADWKSSISRIAQNAMTKSKEMAETTRINVEISNAEQKLRTLQQSLGQHLIENPQLLSGEDETSIDLIQQAKDVQASIEALKEALMELRNINICPECGAEVNRSSKFCGKCGAQMERKALERADEPKTCPACGEPIDDDMVFCGSCGNKLK